MNETILTLDRNLRQLVIADAGKRIRHVFIHDLVISAQIGVHTHEKIGPQRIRINVDLSVEEAANPLNDDLVNTVCYEHVIDGIKEIVGTKHYNLAETLAEEIADMCLKDARVGQARIRVEKLDVVPEALSVGIEIERRREPL